MSTSDADDVTIPVFSGLIPDEPDPRDRSYAEYALARSRVAPPPAAFSLIAELPPPFAQGNLGSCTAQAVAGCYAHLHHKLFGEWLTLSRLHVYYQTRWLENPGSSCRDSGAALRSACKALTKGACREELWPYLISDYCGPPGRSCLDNAPGNQLLQYLNLDHQGLQGPGRSRDAQQALEDLIVHSLVSGYPVVFAGELYRNFAPGPPDDRIPWPSGERWMWHAMLLYGYDRGIGMYKVQNSWGAGWGYQGKCRIPMGWINRDGIDFWTMRAVE